MKTVRILRAPVWLLSSTAIWLMPQASAERSAISGAASDEIFASSFQPVGYAAPLVAPEGPDRFYTAQITIGNQVFSLDVDTTSATLGVAGNTCTSCAGLSPRYIPSSSAVATSETASSSYGDGSGWSGPIYSDTVGLGNGTPSLTLDLVDITLQKQFFESGNDYQGILGLGPQQLALPNTTGYLPAAATAGLPDVFAFELCDDDGTLWIGGDGAPQSPQRTPLVPISASNPLYRINVNGMSLGNTVIASNASANFHQPVLSSGTSLFYVPTPYYNAFKTVLQSSAEFKSLFGAGTLSNMDCITNANVTDTQIDSVLPHISLSLPSLTNVATNVTIQASALDTYLYNAGGGQYCLAIQDAGTSNPSTFGIAFLQAFHTVIDVSGGSVGFARPTTCTQSAARRR